MSEPAPFLYDEMTTRNAGFLTPAEQRTLHDARVFVCGVGGMGGAALQSLVRAGVGHFTLADMDVFETSNLNRQLFARKAREHGAMVIDAYTAPLPSVTVVSRRL
jgi:tRNA A37 threonylcarbamoyladenosine dehydratase